MNHHSSSSSSSSYLPPPPQPLPSFARSPSRTRPLPAKHPSRSSPATSASGRRVASLGEGREGSGGWGIQWSTVQGLASSVLGSDVLTGSAPTAAPSESFKRRRKPADAGADGRRSNNSSGSWMGSIGSAAGDAATVVGQNGFVGRGDVRARGRRRPGADQQQYSANGSPSPTAIGGARRDSRRKYKRAMSPDPSEDPAPPMPIGESDALAYVHHVKPTDTMEGVAIMYNIHSSSLRRANGMWPNDSIQRRKKLLLPVEDCGVKGKPFELASSNDNKPDLQVPEPGGEAPEEGEGERDYRHESYVIIDGIGQVEIARLARKKLSHFPPRRRKESASSSGLFGSPPLDESSVFKSMTPGVGLLGHGGESVGAGSQSEELFTKALLDIAQGTTAGLENVGGAIEGFVRKWTAKAQDFAGHDLIELTQRLGFELEEDRTHPCTDNRDREAQGERSGGESGSMARGDGGVVRERLPRTRREREEP